METSEREDLLFKGKLPSAVSPVQFRELIGANKYKAYLNYWYGVIVEEALQLAVEEEIRKSYGSKGYLDNGSFIEEAFFTMAYHYADKEMKEDELKVYTQMLSHFPNNTGILNSYAWRMAEIEINLEDALVKAKRAAELSADDPNSQANIIDTEAEQDEIDKENENA